MTYLILSSIVIMCASLVGVLFTWKHASNFIEKNLSYLVSFSAGVFLIVAYQLGVEVFEIAASPAYALAWIVFGAILLGLMFRIIPSFHHHHDEDCEHEEQHTRLEARRIVLSDAIHNMGDGILLAATFAVSIPLGIATAASVFVHELVQEVSEFFVLKQSGLSIARALKINFLVSSTIVIGAVLGTFVIDKYTLLEVPLLGIATGSFLVVVLYDLIPHSVRSSRNETHYIRHILWFFLGIILMFAVNQFGVHAHGDQHEYELVSHDQHLHE